jgi:hypothetical protein
MRQTQPTAALFFRVRSTPAKQTESSTPKISEKPIVKVLCILLSFNTISGALRFFNIICGALRFFNTIFGAFFNIICGGILKANVGQFCLSGISICFNEGDNVQQILPVIIANGNLHEFRLLKVKYILYNHFYCSTTA